MPKAIIYLYPDIEKASDLKMFQDKSSQIRAFYFNKKYIDEVRNLPSSDKTALYFLDKGEIYVGKSRDGINGLREIDFNNAIVFISEDDSLNDLTIDFLEYKFTEEYKNVSNEEIKEVKVDIYDIPKYNSLLNEIKELLMIETFPKNEHCQPKEEIIEKELDEDKTNQVEKKNVENKENKVDKYIRKYIKEQRPFTNKGRLCEDLELDKDIMERGPPKV